MHNNIIGSMIGNNQHIYCIEDTPAYNVIDKEEKMFQQTLLDHLQGTPYAYRIL